MRHQPTEQLTRALLAVLAANGIDIFPTHIRVFLPNMPPIQLPVKPLPVRDESEAVSQDLRDVILQVLDEAGGPLKTSAIASRAGRAYTSHFRSTVKAMREAGEIVVHDDGYKLPVD